MIILMDQGLTNIKPTVRPKACLQIPQVARLTGFCALFRVLASPMPYIDSVRNPKNGIKTSLRGLVPEFEDTPWGI